MSMIQGSVLSIFSVQKNVLYKHFKTPEMLGKTGGTTVKGRISFLRQVIKQQISKIVIQVHQTILEINFLQVHLMEDDHW